jgi:hypothetical protein
VLRPHPPTNQPTNQPSPPTIHNHTNTPNTNPSFNPWLRKSAHPALNLTPQQQDLPLLIPIPQKAQKRHQALRILPTLPLGLPPRLLIHPQRNTHGMIDNLGHAGKVSGLKATGSHGGGAHAQAAGPHGGAVARHGVLVCGEAAELEHALDPRAVDAPRLQVHQHQVVVGPGGDERVAQPAGVGAVAEAFGQGARVGQHGFLVGDEFRGLGLLEGDGQGGDGVVVGPALVAGEDGGVDGGLEVVGFGLVELVGGGAAGAFAEEDHGAAGAAEGFVGGGGDDVGVGEGGGDHVRGDEAGDVRHVGEEVGADGFGDGAHAGVVDQAAVGGGAGDDDLGAVEGCEFFEFGVVDQAGRLVQAVRQGFEVFGDHGDFLGGCLVTM